MARKSSPEPKQSPASTAAASPETPNGSSEPSEAVPAGAPPVRGGEPIVISRHQQEQELAARLAAPFELTEVKFKPQTISGNRALAVPFVDARVIQDRLDEVLGVMGWQDSYECLPDSSVVCRLKIRLGDEWITKEDVGGQSEQPDEGDRRKAAFSDALKRAAVKFGIGRYLYRQKPTWVDYDPQKKQFVKLPVLVVPDVQQRKAAQRPAAEKKESAKESAEAAPKKKPTVAERIKAADKALAADGLCAEGALITSVINDVNAKGHGAQMVAWQDSPAAIEAVGVACEEFLRRLFEQRVRDDRLSVPDVEAIAAKVAAGKPPSNWSGKQLREALDEIVARRKRAG